MNWLRLGNTQVYVNAQLCQHGIWQKQCLKVPACHRVASAAVKMLLERGLKGNNTLL